MTATKPTTPRKKRTKRKARESLPRTPIPFDTALRGFLSVPTAKKSAEDSPVIDEAADPVEWKGD